MASLIFFAKVNSIDINQHQQRNLAAIKIPNIIGVALPGIGESCVWQGFYV